MDPDHNDSQLAFLTPGTCGVHQLYAWAWLDPTPGIVAKTSTAVVIQPVNDVNALIASTKASDFSNLAIRVQLLQVLDVALQAFEQNQAQAGADAIGSYMEALNATLGRGISTEKGRRLIGQADALLQCVPKAHSNKADMDGQFARTGTE